MLKKIERKAIDELVAKAKKEKRSLALDACCGYDRDEQGGIRITTDLEVHLHIKKGDSCETPADATTISVADICEYNELMNSLVNSGLRQVEHAGLTDIELCGWLSEYDEFSPREDK